MGVSPSALGKIVGSVNVEPGRQDVGLDFKRNGQYQLIGYVRRAHDSNQSGSVTFDEGSASPASVWGQADMVKIVGSKSNTNMDDENGAKYQWEY